MTLIAYLHARLAEIRDDGERGDSPVPTAVIIMGLVVVGMAVTGFVFVRLRRMPSRQRGQLIGTAVVFVGMLVAFALGIYHLAR